MALRPRRVARFRYPTAVQRRSSLAFLQKKDVIIQAQTGSGKTLAYLMPAIDNMDFVARRMLQVMIIVPSRELVIQTVMLAFRLFGGNVNVERPRRSGQHVQLQGSAGHESGGYFRGGARNARGIRGRGGDCRRGSGRVGANETRGFLEVDLAATIVADEADQLFEQYPEAMETLLAPSPYARVMEDRQIVLCGVHVPREFVNLCEARGHLRSPLEVSMGNPGRVPSGVAHRRLVVPRQRKLVALARQIRADLRFAGEDAPPPRTIVFVPAPRRREPPPARSASPSGTNTHSPCSSPTAKRRCASCKTSRT